jgi:hypothetical protein
MYRDALQTQTIQEATGVTDHNGKATPFTDVSTG